ncbi:MAG: DNA translocase FtsK [Lachnospiraceae bacterium]|nr:DNA translocase FtsK [Lachnospiraceae bacterium]
MGTSKSQNTQKRTYTRRKPTQKELREQEEKRQSFRDEITLWLMLAVCIILFIANFGFGGVVGGSISSFFFGMMGVASYIFPICLFVGTVFVLSNRKNSIATTKIIAFVLFVCFVCMLAQMIADTDKGATAVSAFSFSREHKTGGGFIGGLLEQFLCSCFGVMGAYVINIVVLIISVVLITEKSALSPFKKGGKAIYSTAKDEGERMRSAHIQRKEERSKEQARKRMERVVTGVAHDTKLPDPKQPAEFSDEVSELKFPEEDVLPKVGESRRVPLVSVESEVEPESKSTKTLQVTPISSKTKSIRELAEEAAVVAEPEPISVPEASDSLTPEPMLKKEETKPKKISEEEINQEIAAVDQQVEQAKQNKAQYTFPPVTLLKQADRSHGGDDSAYLNQTAEKLKETLKNFGVNITITAINRGPSVTRYEFQPEMGVKVSKIVNLADDIKLNLAAADIRIEAPIPGKAAIGIEIPNKQSVPVLFRELVESREFHENQSPITFAVGKDIAGRVMVADIAKMPHLLIAGATGSGKSVCINTIIMSIIYRAMPEDVKLIMIDPKVVELSVYNGIPHLMIPVVTDPKKAAGALNWAVAEMTDRYQKFAEYGVRDLKGYNQKIDSIADIADENKPVKLPQIVIIVDELADLMMVAPSDVEDAICRLAQLARACGIHLVIATQRPSVNVITGLIKANMPSRIAFAVTSGVDSRTILDANGAEKLLGKGDMLYYPQNLQKPLRVQGAFISDKEVADVVDFLKNHNEDTTYNQEVADKMNTITIQGGIASGGSEGVDDRDEHFVEAAKLLIDKDKGSIGMIQRYFKVGFNRAARIMDQLEEAGVVGPEDGTKPRQILMTEEQLYQYLENE